jgi:septum formation protein
MTEVILASKSPRRQELLRNLINQFFVINSDVDERVVSGEKPAEFVERLAKEKAILAGEKVASGSSNDLIVIAADTIVVDGTEILGKPIDKDDAWRILEQLKGKNHFVLSGVALYDPFSKEIDSRVISTEVIMRDYRDDEIQAYVDSGDPFDKAGAYAIQNQSFNPVPQMTDCYANVMGLPLCDLYVLMKSMGVEANHQVAENCQVSIQYQCPVYQNKLFTETG